MNEEPRDDRRRDADARMDRATEILTLRGEIKAIAEELDRNIYGADGTVGIAESLRTVNAWIVAHELKATREQNSHEWWQHDTFKLFGGALIALGGAVAERFLFR